MHQRAPVGVRKAPVRAAHCYQVDAQQGYVYSGWLLGQAYTYGVWVSISPSPAANWYRPAAETGNPRGMVSWAYSRANGRGVERNDVEALNWFPKAAALHEPDAIAYIGMMYAGG